MPAPADALVDRLRADLTSALRGRDRARATVLRSLLAAVANAEAQPIATDAARGTSEGAVAGAVPGVGATEVARRVLSAEEVRGVLYAEREEYLRAARELAGRGADAQAAGLRERADLVAAYLD